MNETVFDYGVTDNEKMFIRIEYWDKDEYMKNTSTKRKLQHLYLMFVMRGEGDKAKVVSDSMADVAEEVLVV
jgi:hypothetical protein